MVYLNIPSVLDYNQLYNHGRYILDLIWCTPVVDYDIERSGKGSLKKKKILSKNRGLRLSGNIFNSMRDFCPLEINLRNKT